MSKVIFLFLLLSVSALAEDLFCPYLDNQSQCYLDLCKDAKDNIVPLSPQSFQDEMKNYNYEVPTEVKKDLAGYVASVKKFQAKRKKFLDRSRPEAIASQLTDNFMGSEDMIDRLLSGKVSFTESGHSVEAILSDIDPSQNAFYQKVTKELLPVKQMVADYKKRARSEWTPIIFLKFYPLMAEYYKKHPGPNQVKLEESKKLLGEELTPGVLQRIADGFVNEDFFGMMREKFPNVKPLLSEAFKKFRGEMKASDSPKMVEENFLRSCKIAQYFLDKVKGRDLQAEYVVAQKNSLEKMNRIFLPMLSSHTREFVISKMDKDLFVPLVTNPSIYPDLKQLSMEMDEVAELELSSYFESEDSLKRDLASRTCDSTVSVPDGSYDGQIHIPLATMALGHGDTVTHEVGHWLSAILSGDEVSPESKTNLLKLRACLNSFYKDPGPTLNKKYPADGTKTEEDFADWFDFTMNGDMKSHFTCDATKMIPMFTQYISGQKFQPPGDLYTPVPMNNHSNDVFRELHELLVKGMPIPEACSKFMEQSPDAPKACKL